MDIIEEQIDNLRPAVYSGLATNLYRWMIGISLVLVIFSIFLWNPIPLIFVAFLAIVAMSIRQSGTNLTEAIIAFDTCEPTTGLIQIIVERGDDSDIYHVVVCEENQPKWRYQFIPQHWKPIKGKYTAKIWRKGDRLPPTLVATEQGILIPRYNPELADDANRKINA